MKLNPIMIALCLATTCIAAEAQTTELGSDGNGYKRFLLYPHLQKGFEGMKQGDRARSITEFEQANTIAPNNVAVATYLAEAYRHFGERDRAEALLKEQLKRNPGNTRLSKALSDLRLTTVQALELVPSQTPTASTTHASSLKLSLDKENASSVAAASRVAVHRAHLSNIKSQPRLPRVKHARPAKTPTSTVSQGYYFADTAYKSSASGDFATALLAAREAARLEPENRSYGKLLVYVLVQSSDYEEAESIASKLLKDANADSQELKVQRDEIRRRLAYSHFVAANKALDAGDTEAATREASLGVGYAPDLLSHHVQLIRSQLAAGKNEEANQTTTEAIEKLNGEPALLILRGYARYRLGQWAHAADDFNEAVNDKRLTSTEQHNFRVIAAQAAMAAAEPKLALALLEPLDAKNDKSIDIRRQLARAASQRSIYPNPAKPTVLPAPGIICTSLSFTPSCDIWPGEESSDPATPSAESAYKAFAQREYAGAAANAKEAVELSPASSPYRLLLVNALMANGQLEQAEQNATQFIKMGGDDSEMLAARSVLRQRLGQRELANEDAAQALRSDRLSLASEITTLIQLDRKQQARERLVAATKQGGLNDQTDTNIAYLAVLVGDDETALASFNRAKEAGTLPNTATQDAAYTATRVGHNDRALEYFKQTIDLAEVRPSLLTPQQLFNTRREIADRSRQWGANAAVSYRGISASALTTTRPDTSNDSVQVGAEAWWRPFDSRDGRTLELFGGLSETLSSKAGFATGAESVQGTIGTRVKPLADINLVLSLERRFAIGSKTTTDWLPRIAYSADTGTDLRVDTSNWMTATVYAEAGRFIKQHQTYATFEGQIGRSFRLDAVNPKLVIFPHAVLGADYNSSFTGESKSAVGVGAGVSLRHWFNEDRYNAPRSYSDISLQYRKRISGDDRASGVFLRFTLAY